MSRAPITARNFDRPEFYLYKFETFLHCDARCGAVEVLVSRDYDNEEARAERERKVTEQARAKGWSVEDGHRCPACVGGAIMQPASSMAVVDLDHGTAGPRFADGTAPGTEKLHDARCMCAGAGCRERVAR